jgi:polysaccharide biosynthesis/export protein
MRARTWQKSMLGLALWLAAAGIPPWLRAQDETVSRNIEGERTTASSYPLGPGDRVAISALHVEEINGNFAIGETGEISLPMLGRIHVSGLTTEQLETELVRRLKDYVVNPQAAVSVSEYGSQPVSVFGAVVHPGTYQLRGKDRLTDVLALAGGLRPDAGRTIKIKRRKDGRSPSLMESGEGDPELVSLEVSVASVMDSGGLGRSTRVLPHDVVLVSQPESVYILGEVEKPGSFPLNERANLPILQAISLAGGIKSTGIAHKAKILRLDAAGRLRTEQPVNITRILSGRDEDLALKANDILFVPPSAGRKAINRATEMAIQAGTQILSWGLILH